MKTIIPIIIILLFILIGIIYKISKRTKYTVQPETETLSEDIGMNILNKQVDIASKSAGKKVNFLNDNAEIYDEIFSLDTSEPLSPKLEQFRTKMLQIIAGKFNIKQTKLLNKINNYISKILYSNSLKDSEDSFLKYYDPTTNDKLILNISQFIFYEVDDAYLQYKLRIGQYICNKSSNQQEIDQIYNWIYQIGTAEHIPVEIRMNAADILRLSNNSKYGVKFENVLEQVRRTEEARPTEENHPDFELQRALFENIEVNRTKPKPRTVYNDSQNVHNTALNESVLTSLKKLHKDYYDPNIINSLNLPEEVEDSVNRIKTDISKFKGDITLFSTYQTILNFIDKHPIHKQELSIRLIEELKDMKDLCATGHLSRLLNVIQGFDFDKEYKIKIDITDEVYATFSHFIQQKIIEDDKCDELLENLSSEKKDVIFNFINNHKSELFERLKQEYKTVEVEDIEDILETCIRKYINI